MRWCWGIREKLSVVQQAMFEGEEQDAMPDPHNFFLMKKMK